VDVKNVFGAYTPGPVNKGRRIMEWDTGKGEDGIEGVTYGKKGKE
jgi:hypothetical protein